MRIFQYISIFACIGLLGFYVYKNSPHYQIIKGEIFNTTYNIKIKTNIKNKNIKDKIKEKLQAVNSSMSVFETTSEISKINSSKSQQKNKLSKELGSVFKAANIIYLQSNGRFDPSLEPLIELWGFGKNKNKIIPTDREINKVKKNIGMNKVKFTSNYQYLTKLNSNIKFNLSAIAKGYAVDEIANLLESEGYHDYLIEIGGEIKAKGNRSDNEIGWNIGINKPTPETSENIMIVSLSNLSVATSGNYRNFYLKDGKIYNHTISSETGKPVLNDVLSVSVFHNSCMYADAYATAIMTMDSKQGINFANKHNLKVIIFSNDFKPLISKAAQSIFSE